MNMMMPRFLLAALVIAPATSFSAWAQITVTVTGEIQEATCTPSLTGTNVSANSIVLEPAQLTDLDVAGKTAKPRTITFVLANCGMSTAINNMWVHFMNADINGISAGRLNTNNPDVAFQIMDVPTGGGAGNQVNVDGGIYGGSAPASNHGTAAPFTGTQGSRAANKSYIVQYYAKAPVTQAGAVSAQVVYTVKYF